MALSVDRTTLWPTFLCSAVLAGAPTLDRAYAHLEVALAAAESSIAAGEVSRGNMEPEICCCEMERLEILLPHPAT